MHRTFAQFLSAGEVDTRLWLHRQSSFRCRHTACIRMSVDFEDGRDMDGNDTAGYLMLIIDFCRRARNLPGNTPVRYLIEIDKKMRELQTILEMEVCMEAMNSASNDGFDLGDCGRRRILHIKHTSRPIQTAKAISMTTMKG